MEPIKIILMIFVATYFGIAIGHIPGLKLNRAGIALLGAIAMMIFGGISTADAVSYVNWPTICLLFGFFVIAAHFRRPGSMTKWRAGLARQLTHPARFLFILMLVTVGFRRFLKPRHCLFRVCAGDRRCAVAQTNQSGSFSYCPCHFQQYWRGGNAYWKPAKHDD